MQMSDSDFSTEMVHKLEREIRKELQADKTFLQEHIKEELCHMKDEVQCIRSDIAQLQASDDEREKATTGTNQKVKDSISELKEKVEDMIKSQRPGNIYSIFVCRTLGSWIVKCSLLLTALRIHDVSIVVVFTFLLGLIMENLV